MNFNPAIDEKTLKSNLEIGKVYEIHNTLSLVSGFYPNEYAAPGAVCERISNGEILTIIGIKYLKARYYKTLIEFKVFYDNKFLVAQWCETDRHFTFKEIV